METEVTTRILLALGQWRKRPCVEAGRQIHTVRYGPTLQRAVNMACGATIEMLAEQFAISRADAFMLRSAGGDCRIGLCRGGLDATADVSFPDMNN